MDLQREKTDSKSYAQIFPNTTLRTLISKQVHHDLSNLTKEDQELATLNQSKSAVRHRVELLLEEKQKQLQSKEEMEAREAAMKEQNE